MKFEAELVTENKEGKQPLLFVKTHLDFKNKEEEFPTKLAATLTSFIERSSGRFRCGLTGFVCLTPPVAAPAPSPKQWSSS